MRKIIASLPVVVLLMLCHATQTFAAYDSAGCALRLYGFYHPNLVKLTWTTEIDEYNYVALPPPLLSFRMEAPGVYFTGRDGACNVGAFIQNVSHTFSDGAFGSIASYNGLGLVLTSLRPEWPDSFHGVELLVDPSIPPQFGRAFENIDGLGYSGKNVYTRQALGDPSESQPIIVKWTVTKGETVVNPQGKFSKTLNGDWVALNGTFVKWNFRLEINGISYNVADYYFPIGNAEYLAASDPLVLNQEYFGPAHKALDREKCTVRYYDMWAFDGASWYYLDNWRLSNRNDDGNADPRFGWKSDGSALVSSVGHETDSAECSRDVGSMFKVNPPPPAPGPTITSVKLKGIKKMTIAGANFGDNPTVFINGVDKTSQIQSASQTEIFLKKKLDLVSGDNEVKVVNSNGNAVFIVSL